MISQSGQFELDALRSKYPRTVSEILSVENGESHLRSIWEIEQRWDRFRRDPGAFEKVIFPGGAHDSIDGEFDVIYAGGSIGLLHAAVMATRYGRKVLVFDSHAVGHSNRNWNLSETDLDEFVKAGLFTRAELDDAIVNRYRSCIAKFYDSTSEVKTPVLHLNGVQDVSVDADLLLESTAAKFRAAGGVLMDGVRFNRAAVLKEKVIIECADRSGAQLSFAAKLFVDATGTNSPAARQLNSGQAITHICPTVGSVSRGFVQGKNPDEVDLAVGEILVTTEDSTDGRQLIWKGFPANPHRGEFATSLMFHESVDATTNQSLFELFEEYFDRLATYKQLDDSWKMVRPVFGYTPGVRHASDSAPRTATARVLLIGDAAGASCPLTLCTLATHIRKLSGQTSRTEEALRSEQLDEESLSRINAAGSGEELSSALADLTMQLSGSVAKTVNENMNALMLSLSRLDKNMRCEAFQSGISSSSFIKILSGAAMLRPQILKTIFKHLGWKGAAQLLGGALTGRDVRTNPRP